MLSCGNSKLGDSIHHWSIPAITTCPGATKACLKVCYASTRRFKTSSVHDKLLQNYKLSRSKQFVKTMIKEIKRRKRPVIRIHVAGDFYSRAYIKKWIHIVKACKHATFFTYTRSWRRPEFLTLLIELGSLPNMRLWLSADKTSGEPPRLGFPIAYMSLDDTDNPPWPVNLVFRVQRQTPKKFLGGSLVCPVEQGIPRQNHITCAKCRLCFARVNHPHLQRGGVSLKYKTVDRTEHADRKSGVFAETGPSERIPRRGVYS